MTSEQQEITIDLPKLFNLSANLLVASFQRQSKENLKRLFKELKQGGRVDAGQITAEQSGAVYNGHTTFEKIANLHLRDEGKFSISEPQVRTARFPNPGTAFYL